MKSEINNQGHLLAKAYLAGNKKDKNMDSRMKILYKDVRLKDFRTGTILHMIAKKDVALACQVAEKFGGLSEYIQQWTNVRSQAVHRKVIEKSHLFQRPKEIAREVGLSVVQVRNIIKKHTNKPNGEGLES